MASLPFHRCETAHFSKKYPPPSDLHNLHFFFQFERAIVTTISFQNGVCTYPIPFHFFFYQREGKIKERQREYDVPLPGGLVVASTSSGTDNIFKIAFF